MTVPAFSLSSVLPGAPSPSTGTGAAAPGVAAGLFDSLLAGLASANPGATRAGKVDAAQDPLDSDQMARDAATASQDAGLALLLVAPGAAPVLAPLASAVPDGGPVIQAAPRQIQVPGLIVDPAAAQPPASGEAADAPAVDGEAPRAAVVATAGTEVPPPLLAPRLGDRTGAAPVAAGPSPAPVQAPPAATPPVAVQAAAPQAVAQQAVAARVTAAPAVETSAAVEVVATPAPARVAASDGEARRPAPARGDRRVDGAGRPTAPADASPAKQAALAALANDNAPDAVDPDASAGPDIAAATDATEAPETRQPALPGEIRAQIAQAAMATETAAAARGSPETVARLAADIVRKLEGQSTRFDLELDPHGMGKVDVAIEIDRDGKLTAAMSFDSAQSAADLRGRSGELRLALEQAGFDVSEGGLTFDLANQDGGREAGQQQQDRAWTGRAFQRAQSGAEEADLTLATPSNPTRWTRSGVDIRI
ncbi:MAG: flagellar hook-length control protein FliK [Caulobacter sp.]|nr:flagellar hook-length control protein FliK [Caulobacter sp.]